MTLVYSICSFNSGAENFILLMLKLSSGCELGFQMLKLSSDFHLKRVPICGILIAFACAAVDFYLL